MKIEKPVDRASRQQDLLRELPRCLRRRCQLAEERGDGVACRGSELPRPQKTRRGAVIHLKKETGAALGKTRKETKRE